MPKNYGVPLAIIIAGLLVAGAIMFGGSGRGLNLTPYPSQPAANSNTTPIRPADEKDHLLGHLGSPVTVIEYSDLECPFCKMFHLTMQEAMSYYNGGEEVQVSWVFRNFPLVSLHSKAPHEAEAAECAGELGGNTKFWAYVDKVFATTPSNDGLDPALLPTFAEQIGLNKKAFTDCLNSGKYTAKVQASYDEAIAAGGTGTPFVTVIGPDGKQTTLPGAVPLDQLKTVIDGYLGTSSTTTATQ